MDTNPVLVRGGPLRFCGFVLDRDRAVLRHGTGESVPLRPKALALLEHLVERPGRVATRDELMDAIWPDVTVCDDNLTQTVAELRRVLGPGGARLIRTMPRRGYMFDPEVAGTTLPEPIAAPEPAEMAAPRVAARRTLWKAGALTGAAVLMIAVTLWFTAAPEAPQPGPASEPPRAVAMRLYREGFELWLTPGPGQSDWLAMRDRYLRAIEADPDYPPPYAMAALTYTSMIFAERSLNPTEDLRRAEALTERAMSLAPNAASTQGARAAVLRQHGRHDEALEAYRRALEIDSTYHSARANAAWMLILLGRPDEAVAPLRTSIALVQPDHALAQGWKVNLGIAKLHLGIADFGAEEFRAAAERGAGAMRDVRRLYLAAALALSGRVEEARDVASDARRLAPHMTIAWFRGRNASDNPGYLAGREMVFRGLALAGVPE